MGIPYVGPLPSKVGDLQSAYIYSTEAEFNSAPAGSSGHLNVDSLVNWPTIWNLPGRKGPAVYPFMVSSLADAESTEINIRFTQYLYGDRGSFWTRYRYFYPDDGTWNGFSDWEMFISSLSDPVDLVGEEPYIPAWDDYYWTFLPLTTKYDDVLANGGIARRRYGGRLSVGTPTEPDDAATKDYVDGAIAGAGGGMVGVPTYIQDAEPAVTGPAIWYQTSGGVVIKKWVQLS